MFEALFIEGEFVEQTQEEKCLKGDREQWQTNVVILTRYVR